MVIQGHNLKQITETLTQMATPPLTSKMLILKCKSGKWETNAYAIMVREYVYLVNVEFICN